MLEMTSLLKEIVKTTTDVKSYIPEFFQRSEQKEHELTDILEPVSKKNDLPSREANLNKYKDYTNDESDAADIILDDEDDELVADADLYESGVSGCPIEGHGGIWEGFRGDSVWYPNRDEVPKNPQTNPDGLTWGEILDKYGIEGIPFKDGEPDFSQVSKGTVEIDNFTDNRFGKGGNFDQACEKLAEQRGCTKEEVKEWMKDNKYTWHERSDCKTMDKVPTEVHGNVRHEGGISEIKSNNSKEAE